MRRIRKITSNDKRVPVPKENKELHPTVIKKGSLNNKVGRITISPSNIPTVQSRPVNVLMNEHPYVKRPISKIEPIWIGETIFIIGEIQNVYLPENCINIDGFVDIEATGTITCSGLDSYHLTKKLSRLSYAKPNTFPVKV